MYPVMLEHCKLLVFSLWSRPTVAEHVLLNTNWQDSLKSCKLAMIEVHLAHVLLI